MAPHRLVFMGTPAFAVGILEQLLALPALFDVVAVVTQPDRPAGRGRKLTPSSVKQAASARGIPTHAFRFLKKEATARAIEALDADIAVVAAYGRLLPPALLRAFPRGCVNVHASLLPRHRGAAPIAHAILSGDQEAGVSIMQMDAGLDTGPVYARRHLPIAASDTQETLSQKLSKLGGELLGEVLPDILHGNVTPSPQDDAKASYAPLLHKDDGRIDFSQPASILERRVRALAPWPGTFAEKDGVRVKILRAMVAASAGPPGEVTCTSDNGVTVGCGHGALCLLEVQPAGRKRMPAKAWITGRGVRVGERFDSPPSATARENANQP